MDEGKEDPPSPPAPPPSQLAVVSRDHYDEQREMMKRFTQMLGQIAPFWQILALFHNLTGTKMDPNTQKTCDLTKYMFYESMWLGTMSLDILTKLACPDLDWHGGPEPTRSEKLYRTAVTKIDAEHLQKLFQSYKEDRNQKREWRDIDYLRGKQKEINEEFQGLRTTRGNGQTQAFITPRTDFLEVLLPSTRPPNPTYQKVDAWRALAWWSCKMMYI